MNITAKTQKVGLLGWPLGHSLSPVMQNAAFAASDLNYVYLPLPVQPELLLQAVEGIKALGFVGANVTIPHKVTIMNYLDEIDTSARLVGAVNTLVIKEGRLIGYNTDAAGYMSALHLAGVEITGRKAVILGAGGAARAVVAGLITAQIGEVTIGARQNAQVSDAVSLFKVSNVLVRGIAWDAPEFIDALSQADIIVNTTPLGMYPNISQQPPIAWDLLKPSAVISDLIYNPLTTKFMVEAARRGYIAVGGKDMLIEQGALAFSLWTGCNAPRAVMKQAFYRGLKTLITKN